MTQPAPKSGGLDALRAEHERQSAKAPETPAEEPEGDEPEGDETPETDDKDAELARLRKALKEANRDAERNRRKAKAKESDEEGDEPEPRDTEASNLRRELHTRDAIELLREEGVKGDRKRLRRVVRMLDSVDPDEVEYAIEQLKEDDPALFSSKEDDEEEKPKRKRAPRSGPGGAEPNRQARPRDNLSPTSRMLLQQGKVLPGGNW